MKPKEYEQQEFLALQPLLRSIVNELEERTRRVRRLEKTIAALTGDRFSDPARVRMLVAEAATHRREIRLAQAELERLGCTVVGTEPLTLRIPGRVGEAKRSFVWQAGDPVLK